MSPPPSRWISSGPGRSWPTRSATPGRRARFSASRCWATPANWSRSKPSRSAAADSADAAGVHPVPVADPRLAAGARQQPDPVVMVRAHQSATVAVAAPVQRVPAGREEPVQRVPDDRALRVLDLEPRARVLADHEHQVDLIAEAVVPVRIER